MFQVLVELQRITVRLTVKRVKLFAHGTVIGPGNLKSGSRNGHLFIASYTACAVAYLQRILSEFALRNVH